MNFVINIILFPLFMIYLLVICIRNYLFDIELFKSTKLPCKIISVGNISVGGTGKTPTVIALAAFLQQQNNSVAILSRGYGRKSSGIQLVTDGKTAEANWEKVGDEPTLMAKQLSNIPIVVDENRVRGGKYLLNKFNPEIIILDDGFQHRKIHRDIDIVLINSNMSKISKRIFGFTNYREPWKSLKRAHLIFLTKSTFIAPSVKLLEKLKSIGLPVIKTDIMTQSYLLGAKNNKVDINCFSEKTALIFSGIGDYKSFENTVQTLKINILDSINFSDHNKYSKSDIERIRNRFIKTGAEIIITTEKDFLKFDKVDLPIYTIPIIMNIGKDGYNQIQHHLN